MTDKAALAPDNVGAFITALAGVIEGAKSLMEIETWLKEQPFVESVSVMNYLMKSNPPQREIRITLNTKVGREEKILNFFEIGPTRFQFHLLRDP
jgi:hypothetical protein